MKLKQVLLLLLFCISSLIYSQKKWDTDIKSNLKKVLKEHKDFVSIPNLPENKDLMLKNMHWVANHYKELNFKINYLEAPTLPLLFVEKEYNPNYKTILFYFHIDGQPVDASNWNQENPFIPVLKSKNKKGAWQKIDWNKLNTNIDDEWRIFARAAADDKAPIVMLIYALKILKQNNLEPKFNIKVIFDPEEEYSSEAFLSTLEKYKSRYNADAMLIMDGPAHESNQPTITFGCRGIVTCSITTYGAILPQHSGHLGNYSPNPIFSLSHILSSMKDENGKVLVKDYYSGIELSENEKEILNNVPDNKSELNKRLGISKEESVGNNYQEALQYPSLNVRHIETSYKGDKPKTVIPKIATAHIDVRLVLETDSKKQIEKIKTHIKGLGYKVLDREPTDQERLNYSKIVTFKSSEGINAFRTELDTDLGKTLRNSLTKVFNKKPISIRTMGGTVPIIPAVKALNIPALIIPTVNMDNNQHSPNENIRVGNIRDGIKICLAILQTKI